MFPILGQGKSSALGKNLGQKIFLKMQDLCIPGLSYSVGCKIMLMLKFGLPMFFPLRALFWSVKWLQLYICKIAARQGSGFFSTLKSIFLKAHMSQPASLIHHDLESQDAWEAAGPLLCALPRCFTEDPLPYGPHLFIKEWVLNGKCHRGSNFFKKIFAVQLLLERVWILWKQIEL